MRDNLNAELQHAAKRTTLTDDAVSGLELLGLFLGLLFVLAVMVSAAVYLGGM